jgi:hypothetical protein
MKPVAVRRLARGLRGVGSATVGVTQQPSS